MYNPDALLERMPYRILEEWMAYEEQEPFGQLALRIGYATASLGNLLAKPKGRRAWRPSDFMPDNPRRQSKRVSPDRQMDQIYGIAVMMNAEIKDPKGLLKQRYQRGA